MSSNVEVENNDSGEDGASTIKPNTQTDPIKIGINVIPSRMHSILVASGFKIWTTFAKHKLTLI